MAARTRGGRRHGRCGTCHARRTRLNGPEDGSRNSRADWFALAIQFICGVFAGALLGWLVGGRRRGWHWLDPGLLPFWIAGAALVGGALAARHGDNLWLGRSFVHPHDPKHSAASRRTALVIGVLGSGLMLFAFLRNLLG